MQGQRYTDPIHLNDKVTATFHEAGHILGSAILELSIVENNSTTKIIFSGDLGQCDKPLIRDPTFLDGTDFLVMESTYGDRDHKDAGDILTQLADVINDTGSNAWKCRDPHFRSRACPGVDVPLVHADRIPDLPIYLDSPMAVNVVNVFTEFRTYLDDKTQQLFTAGHSPLQFQDMHMVRSVQDSKKINRKRGSNIIMSDSGMCTTGRIKHHLRQNISRADSTVLFVGFQAPGTLGRHILNGDHSVRIHGKYHPVSAKVLQIHGFSAHADCHNLIRWISHFHIAPRHIFLTHGDMDAASALSRAIKTKHGWKVTIPPYDHIAELE